MKPGSTILNTPQLCGVITIFSWSSAYSSDLAILLRSCLIRAALKPGSCFAGVRPLRSDSKDVNGALVYPEVFSFPNIFNFCMISIWMAMHILIDFGGLAYCSQTLATIHTSRCPAPCSECSPNCPQIISRKASWLEGILLSKGIGRAFFAGHAGLA